MIFSKKAVESGEVPQRLQLNLQSTACMQGCVVRLPPKFVQQVISLVYTQSSFITIYILRLVSIQVGAKGVALIPFGVVSLRFRN